MKLLLINDVADPRGGAEIMTRTLMQGLARRGHEVRVLASDVGEPDADYLCKGAADGARQMLRQTWNPSARRAVAAAIQDFQPDVAHVRMHLTQLSPAILGPLREVPSVYHAVMYEAVCPTGLKMLPGGQPCHFTAGRACLREGCLSIQAWSAMMLKLELWHRGRSIFRKVVANSETMRDILEASGVTVDQVIHNGVPDGGAGNGPGPEPTLVYAGRLSKEKGVDTLLSAFARAEVSDAKLLLAGDGPLRGSLQNRAGELGLRDRVQFLGHQSRDECERAFAGAWAQAVPSAWREPFGIVTVEAMLRGTAVIASDAGGPAEIVEHENTGLLAPAGDEAAWANAIRRVLTDRHLVERMGNAGRARAIEYFSEDLFLDRFESLYRAMLEETAASNLPSSKLAAGATS